MINQTPAAMAGPAPAPVVAPPIASAQE